MRLYDGQAINLFAERGYRPDHRDTEKSLVHQQTAGAAATKTLVSQQNCRPRHAKYKTSPTVLRLCGGGKGWVRYHGAVVNANYRIAAR